MLIKAIKKEEKKLQRERGEWEEDMMARRASHTHIHTQNDTKKRKKMRKMKKGKSKRNQP